VAHLHEFIAMIVKYFFVRVHLLKLLFLLFEVGFKFVEIVSLTRLRCDYKLTLFHLIVEEAQAPLKLITTTNFVDKFAL